MKRELVHLGEAMARWEDEQSLSTLFAAIPLAIAVNIRQGHVEHPDGFSGMRHDADSESAYFVQAGSTFIRVWTFTQISFPQAAELWMVLDEDLPYSKLKTKAAFERVVGVQLEWLQ